MIKFFRHIRKSLIEKNQMGKYFKYAIGEILLVVIGILIALQINNWNEGLNNEKKIVSIFKDIQEDLLNDIKETDRFLNLYYEKQDSISLKIIKEQYTAHDYLDSVNRSLPYIGTFDYPLVISEQSYLLLNENKNIIPEDYKSVIKDLNSLYIEDKHFLIQELEGLKDFTYGFQERLYDKLWFKSFIYESTLSNEALAYLTSDVYRAKMTLFRQRLDNVQDYAIRIKHKAIQNYIVLNEIVNPNQTLPKQISDFVNGSLKISENYVGTFLDKVGKRIEFREENGLLFWYDDEQIYLDKLLLSEISKDSLEFVMWNESKLKIERDDQGQIEGYTVYDKTEEVSQAKRLKDD